MATADGRVVEADGYESEEDIFITRSENDIQKQAWCNQAREKTETKFGK
jgi:hypothetical protein